MTSRCERGQPVLVRCANGKTRENVVWETFDHMVYVCSQRQFNALRDGRDAPPPIGFLEDDVMPLIHH